MVDYVRQMFYYPMRYHARLVDVRALLWLQRPLVQQQMMQIESKILGSLCSKVGLACETWEQLEEQTTKENECIRNGRKWHLYGKDDTFAFLYLEDCEGIMHGVDEHGNLYEQLNNDEPCLLICEHDQLCDHYISEQFAVVSNDFEWVNGLRLETLSPSEPFYLATLGAREMMENSVLAVLEGRDLEAFYDSLEELKQQLTDVDSTIATTTRTTTITRNTTLSSTPCGINFYKLRRVTMPRIAESKAWASEIGHPRMKQIIDTPEEARSCCVCGPMCKVDWVVRSVGHTNELPGVRGWLISIQGETHRGYIDLDTMKTYMVPRSRSQKECAHTINLAVSEKTWFDSGLKSFDSNFSFVFVQLYQVYHDLFSYGRGTTDHKMLEQYRHKVGGDRIRFTHQVFEARARNQVSSRGLWWTLLPCV
jgi:hypothetical protein